MLGRGYREFTQYFPRARLGRARRRGDLPGLARGGARGAGRRGRASRRPRHHQSARDRRALGPPDARAGRAGDRLAGPAHQRALPRARGSGRRDDAPASAPAWWPIPISPRPSWSGCSAIRSSGAGRAGRAGGGHGGELAGGAAHRRPGPRERPHQRSRTLLYDLGDRDWHPELLELFGFRASCCPTIVPSAGVVGECDAAHFGFALPIAGLAGDQQAALFGQGCCSDGLAKNTYGTGAFLLVHRGDRLPAAAGRRARDRGVRSAGRAGLRARGQRLHRGRGGAVAARRARHHRHGGGDGRAGAERGGHRRRRFVPAFVGLGTPHWEAEARGTIVGLTRGTTRAHLVRAALEAIAFSSADLLEAMAGATAA